MAVTAVIGQDVGKGKISNFPRLGGLCGRLTIHSATREGPVVSKKMSKRSAEQDVNDLHVDAIHAKDEAKDEISAKEDKEDALLTEVIVTYLEWFSGEIILSHFHGRVTAAEFDELRRAQFDDDSYNPR